MMDRKRYFTNREPSDIYELSAGDNLDQVEEHSYSDEQNSEMAVLSDAALSSYGTLPSVASPGGLVRRTNRVAVDGNGHNKEANNHRSSPPSASGGNNDIEVIDSILHEYAAACRLYGCADRINAGVLTTFRFCLPSLRVSGSFFDADMLALAEVLLRHINGSLSYIRRLDFSLAAVDGAKRNGKRGIRSHGAFTLSQVLRVSRHVEEVFLPGNRIGPYGASAIFVAVAGNPTLQTLLMRGCRIGERGAWAFAAHVLSSPDSATSLREVDLSANLIGFHGCLAVEKAMKRKTDRLLENGDSGNDGLMEVDLEGNLVFQEVMNCLTHGLGILLAFVGTYLLSKRVKGKPDYYVFSCAVYSTSLVVLYTSSTLFHSFFALQRTKYIFKVFDMCAIYILIAGSYTPFLSIALHHEPVWSGHLLSFIWVCSLAGIAVEAFLPLWKHKPKFTLSMYLGMGWSVLLAMTDLLEALPTGAIHLVIAGGLGYTLGVPFFVRNNNLDHSIWHLFVLAGSLFHWICIYKYIVTLEERE